MNSKIGQFIKQLRGEKNLSQQQLSDLIYIDRSVLSKWERGISTPPIDKMKLLCNIFDISIDELISGEKNNKKNIQNHRDNLFEYLINFDIKYKKFKKLSIITILLLFFLSFLFLLYYFGQTYNSEKIYKVYSKSDNFVVNDGILVLTREKSYLKIGGINNQIYDIELLIIEDNNEYVLFSGSSDSILIDYSGYNSKINHNNINTIKDNLFLKIDDELVKLYILENYKNNKLIISDNTDSKSLNKTSKINDENKLLSKIKKEFKCDKEICTKIINNIKIDYSIEINIFYIKDKDVFIQYDVDQNIFDYSSKNLIYTIENGTLNCESKNCDNYLESYNKYFKKIIQKYIT